MALGCVIGRHKWEGNQCSVCGKTRDKALPASDTRVYRPDGWNIEFDVPTDWELIFEDRPDPPNYGVFGIVGPRADGPRPSVLLMAQIVEASSGGLSAYMASAERQFGQMFREFRMVRTAQEAYRGVPTAVMEYAYQGQSGAIQELNMTAFYGERISLAFQFICEADKRQVAADRATQRAVIDSMRVGARGIRVPFLSPTGRSASSCAGCGTAIREPNALFDGRRPLACYCDRCWRT